MIGPWREIRSGMLFVQFSNRERQRRAEGGLQDDQGRDRGQYASGICMSRAMMTDTVTATAVRIACVIEGRFFLSSAQNFISQSSSPPVRISKITIDRMEHGLQWEFWKQTSTPKAFASRR